MMKALLLTLSTATLFFSAGSGSIAQDQQEIGAGQCPVAKATLCWTDVDGVKRCETVVQTEPCDGGSGGDGEEPGDGRGTPQPQP